MSSTRRASGAEDIREGALFIAQNKTGAKRAIEVIGELADVIERIRARPRERLSAYLVQDDNGRPLTLAALGSRFAKAGKVSGVSFQFRDIRAKTASDIADLGHSQRLLGHKHRDMTEHYVRQRIGQRVKPLRRRLYRGMGQGPMEAPKARKPSTFKPASGSDHRSPQQPLRGPRFGQTNQAGRALESQGF